MQDFLVKDLLSIFTSYVW